jgi:hypothetical protein
MVVVKAWTTGPIDTISIQHEIMPVLALSHRKEHIYLRDDDGRGHEAWRTHEEMLRGGWTYNTNGPFDRFDVLVQDSVCGFCRAAEIVDVDYQFTAYEVVPCPWKSSQDAKRLALTIDRVRENVARQVEYARGERPAARTSLKTANAEAAPF